MQLPNGVELKPLNAEQQAAFDAYLRVMEERVIPEIVEAIKERERCAARLRFWPLAR